MNEPDAPGPGDAQPKDEPEGRPEIDFESAFAAIIADFSAPTPRGTGPWPALEDLPDDDPEVTREAGAHRDLSGLIGLTRKDAPAPPDAQDDPTPGPGPAPGTDPPSAGPPGPQTPPAPPASPTVPPAVPPTAPPSTGGPGSILVPGLHGPGAGPAGPGVPRDRGRDDDEEEGYVPPEPPPLPRGDLVSRLAWGSVIGGPLFLVAAALAWQDLPSILLMLALVAFVGGFVTLVARMPPEPPDDPDDGAVV